MDFFVDGSGPDRSGSLFCFSKNAFSKTCAVQTGHDPFMLEYKNKKAKANSRMSRPKQFPFSPPSTAFDRDQNKLLLDSSIQYDFLLRQSFHYQAQ